MGCCQNTSQIEVCMIQFMRVTISQFYNRISSFSLWLICQFKFTVVICTSLLSVITSQQIQLLMSTLIQKSLIWVIFCIWKRSRMILCFKMWIPNSKANNKLKSAMMLKINKSLTNTLTIKLKLKTVKKFYKSRLIVMVLKK